MLRGEALALRSPGPDGARRSAPLNARAGVGFKSQHFDDILQSPGGVGFFEIHAENFMGAGGPPHARLERLRRDYPLSIHGVSLSLGGQEPLDLAHVDRLKALVDRYEPDLVSEHLAWSSHNGAYLNDLLPLPYTASALRRVGDRVSELQDRLNRRVLIENPATYVAFASSTLSEVDFLMELALRTGCGLLLDVNNVFVSSVNHRFDAAAYIDAVPTRFVEEIHLAGYAQDKDDDDAALLIDAHCAPVADPVWRLYARALARSGKVPTLIEWDNELPTWPALRAEAERAEALLAAAGARP